MSDSIIKYMCPSCNRCYEYKMDAEYCHKVLPIKMVGKKYTRFKTVEVTVIKNEGQSYDYLNEYNNLREVPPRAELIARWEAPIDDDGNVIY